MSSKLKKFFSSNRISIYTIAGVISGLLIGLLVKNVFWPNDQRVDPYILRYVSLPGTIYIRAFLMLIVPLLISSLSTSLLHSETDSTKSDSLESADRQEINGQKLLLTAFIFFICFSTFAATMGILLMVVIQPGTSSTSILANFPIDIPTQANDLILKTQHRIEQANYRSDSMLNIILSLFPENLIAMLFATSYTKTDVIWPSNLSTIAEPNFVPVLKQTTSYTYRPNMIGICVIAFLLGILLKNLGPERTSTVRSFMKELDHLVGVSFGFLLRFMPGGMFCWMFAEALKMHSISSVAVQLGYFYVVACVAFCLLFLVFYPTVYFAFTRENAFRLYQTLVPAILVALGTTSSAITLPMTMKCMEGKGKLAVPIAQTVLPLGMTIHMNGSALYYPMVALFVAQVKQIHIDPLMLCVLGLFGVLMSMGLPGSPSGGMTIVNHIACAAVIGIDDPQDVLAFIMSFEWIWERIRTATNIIGDCFVAKCVERLLIKGDSKHDADNLEMTHQITS